MIKEKLIREQVINFAVYTYNLAKKQGISQVNTMREIEVFLTGIEYEIFLGILERQRETLTKVEKCAKGVSEHMNKLTAEVFNKKEDL
jgi:hypothetical protein